MAVNEKRRKVNGFDSSCFPCRFYLMQGCTKGVIGHPTLGQVCKKFKRKIDEPSRVF